MLTETKSKTFKRDPQSGALVNTKIEQINAYRKKKQRDKDIDQAFKRLEADIQRVKEDQENIKSLIHRLQENH